MSYMTTMKNNAGVDATPDRARRRRR